jgi:hypothetical protein
VLDKVFQVVEVGGGGGDPLAVTVFFGANNACLLDRCSAFQHVPLNEYEHNIHSIVSLYPRQRQVVRRVGESHGHPCKEDDDTEVDGFFSFLTRVR